MDARYRLRREHAAIRLAPRIGGADALGDIVFERIFAEFTDTISSPALKQVAQHWREVCSPGGLPSWNDLRPSAIKAHLPIVWCYDYDASQDDFLGRLAGVEITGVSSKPFKGTRLSNCG